ncbi:hypothetical protein AB0J80_22210 [Actinoplanes sp. NPDC049548]|uniref:hypothetical protein n=1 Tax=Actinoplanes sp. NPDC049548 TaxID=3155152 RepID=UPI003434633E
MVVSVPAQVVPVRRDEHTIGAFVVQPDRVCYRPAVDVTRLGVAALGAAAVSVAAVGAAVALRRRPAIGSVTMGPGGWVSLKRTGMPPLRSAQPRPWWARLLGARALEVRR